jgi:O-antigen/teichoic acid export membrane protein
VSEAVERPLAPRVGEAMVWNTLAAPLKAAATLLTSVVLARMLGARDYGVYTILLSIIATVGQYTDLGINRSLPRYVPQAEVRLGRGGVEALLRDVLAVKATLAALGVVGLVAGADRLNAWFGLDRADRPWIEIVCAIFVLEVFREIALRVLNSYFRQKLTNGLELATLAVHPAAAALVLWRGGGITGALLVTAGTSLAGAALLWTAAVRVIVNTPARATEFDRHATTRSMVPHAATIYFLLLTKYFAELSFVVFLLAWAGTGKSAIAQFSIGYKTVGVLTNLLAIPLQSVQVPLLARMDSAARPESFARVYAGLLKYLLFVLGPGVCLIWIAAPEAVRLLYGESYLPAGSLIRILMPLFALETLFNISNNVLMVKGNYREMAGLRWASLFAAPLVVAAALWSGPWAVAFVLGVTRVAIAYVSYAIAAHRHGLSFPMEFAGRVAAAALAFLVAATAAYVVVPGRLIAVAAAAGIGAVGFLVAFRLAGGFDAEEKEMLRHFPIPGMARLLRWI